MSRAIAESQHRLLTRENGACIAYRYLEGRSPTVVFLGGFTSDMTGTKACHLEDYCRARDQAYLRFDYQGHGASSGRFVDGTIGEWRDDALAVIERCTAGPLVLVGSSMGAWIMVLAARAMSRAVDAMVGIAPAADFTEELIWKRLSAENRAALERDGAIHVPSEYSVEDCPITLALIQEGRDHLVLGATVPIACPVRLLHGLDDRDVPWEYACRLLRALASDDVTLELVKGGDHRLSETADLARLSRTLDELLNAGT